MKLSEAELAAVEEDLDAARRLCGTFDPDSPPWSAEAELRRLERIWGALRAEDERPASERAVPI